MKSLLNKTLTQFIVCTIIILLLATPLFYLLTKHYYAEDMIDIIEATQQNQPIPELDLEQDIMQGVMIQFSLNQRGIRHCHYTHDPFRLQTFMETFRRYAKTT